MSIQASTMHSVRPEADTASGFWKASPPRRWPSPPPYYSPSSLHEVEACPRRYALRRADYGDGQAGIYPSPVFKATAEGSVVHRALEEVQKAMRAAGARTPEEQVAVMRFHKGFPGFVESAIDKEMDVWLANPRMRHRAYDLRSALRRSSADLALRLRGLVTNTLGSTSPLGPSSTSEAVSGPQQPDPEYAGRRHPLGLGAHPEVDLKAPALRLKGTADLIDITADQVVITDAKTGDPKDTHPDQLRLYATLWAADSERNPTGRPVSSLQLLYRSGRTSVSLPDADAASILSARIDAADAALRATPPEARPAQQKCAYCPVRHLCDAYWQHIPWPEEEPPTQRFGDAHVQVQQAQGPEEVQVTVAQATWPSTPRVGSLAVHPSRPPLEPGTEVRLLGVRFVLEDSGLTMQETSDTERYVWSRNPPTQSPPVATSTVSGPQLLHNRCQFR